MTTGIPARVTVAAQMIATPAYEMLQIIIAKIVPLGIALLGSCAKSKVTCLDMPVCLKIETG